MNIYIYYFIFWLFITAQSILLIFLICLIKIVDVFGFKVKKYWFSSHLSLKWEKCYHCKLKHFLSYNVSLMLVTIIHLEQLVCFKVNSNFISTTEKTVQKIYLIKRNECKNRLKFELLFSSSSTTISKWWVEPKMFTEIFN